MTTTLQIKDGSTLRHLKSARKITAATPLEVVTPELTRFLSVLHKLKTPNTNNVLVHKILETHNLSKGCQLSTSKCWTLQPASLIWLTCVSKPLMMNKMKKPLRKRASTFMLSSFTAIFQRLVAVLRKSLLKSHFVSSRTFLATLFSSGRQIFAKNTCSAQRIRWTMTLTVLSANKKSLKLIPDPRHHFPSLGSLVAISRTMTSHTQDFELRKQPEVIHVVQNSKFSRFKV